MDSRGTIRIALLGDHDPAVTAHRAIPLALAAAAAATELEVRATWVHTASIPVPLGDFLASYHAVWCTPASPYTNMSGAIDAIRYARESGTPFFGTCGGFQHAVIEFSRHVLGIAAASHAEVEPEAREALITPLSCALVERGGTVRLLEGSRARELCGPAELREEYHCSYGLNPAYESRLEEQGLRVTGRDPSGEARIVELDNHPFYVATLFQPERAGLRGEAHPLIAGFLMAAKDAIRGSAELTSGI